jgi:hypothetical protein
MTVDLNPSSPEVAAASIPVCTPNERVQQRPARAPVQGVVLVPMTGTAPGHRAEASAVAPTVRERHPCMACALPQPVGSWEGRGGRSIPEGPEGASGGRRGWHPLGAGEGRRSSLDQLTRSWSAKVRKKFNDPRRGPSLANDKYAGQAARSSSSADVQNPPERSASRVTPCHNRRQRVAACSDGTVMALQASSTARRVRSSESGIKCP